MQLEPSGTGYKVSQIQSDSVIAAAGLKEGDIVVDIDGMPLNGFDHAYDALHHAADAHSFVVHVERDGKKLAMSYAVRED